MLLALISMASGPILNPTIASAQGIVNRQVWAGPDVDGEGGVSRDGSYITYPDWGTGDLAVFEIATGEKRRITHTGTWSEKPEFAEFSIPSPDGKQIAYSWNKENACELRIIGIDGSGARTVFRGDNIAYIWPKAWSSSAQQVFATFYTKDGKTQVVSVSLADGTDRILKSFTSEPSGGVHMSLSPDERYLAYDFPQSGNSLHSDIACISTQNGSETSLIQNPAYDGVFGWTPDGRNILFTSDRTGQNSLWALEVEEGNPKNFPRLLKPDAGRIVPLGVTQKGAVYYTMPGGIREMYTAELDFTSGKLLSPPVPVTLAFTGRNSNPAWSPDGSRLAYLSLRRRTDRFGWGNPADTIVIRTLATGEEREIAVNSVAMDVFQRLRWAPDGRSVVVKGGGNDNKPGAYRVDVETGKVSQLFQDGIDSGQTLLGFTPDNRAVVWVRSGSSGKISRIVVRDLQSGKERELALRASSAGINFNYLGLSPDGRQLAFVTNSKASVASVLSVVPLSGGEAHELLRLQDPDGFERNTFTWTPDGEYIVFGRVRGDLKDPESSKVTLWKIAAQGGEPQKLELAMDRIRRPSIHTDGRRVAFEGGTPAREVWVMENLLPTLKAAK
jgi:Tol biopolymer transport system component